MRKLQMRKQFRAYGAFLIMLISTGFAAEPKVDPALTAITDRPSLPRVLLIGNSISIAYTLPVRALLADVANVHRIPANGGATTIGLRDLERWLGEGHWDVIHFNFGLGDLRHVFPGNKVQNEKGEYPRPGEGAPRVPLNAYENNLRTLINRLKATGAQVIFATTTPLKDDFHGYFAGHELSYNDVARKIVEETGIRLNDLHSVVVARCPELQVDHVHFNTEGNRQLAQSVAASIRAALTAPVMTGWPADKAKEYLELKPSQAGLRTELAITLARLSAAARPVPRHYEFIRL